MNILIIDDTPPDHEIAMEYLQGTGVKYRFYHAYNAVDGLLLYQQNHIDCVLLDYRMPGRAGGCGCLSNWLRKIEPHPLS